MNLCNMNAGILFTFIFVTTEILVFVKFHYEPEIIGEHDIDSTSQYRIILWLFLTLIFIVFEMLVIVTLHNEIMISMILNDMEEQHHQPPFIPMDIETGRNNA